MESVAELLKGRLVTMISVIFFLRLLKKGSVRLILRFPTNLWLLISAVEKCVLCS